MMRQDFTAKLLDDLANQVYPVAQVVVIDVLFACLQMDYTEKAKYYNLNFHQCCPLLIVPNN